jgi:hypothetical protein
MIGITQEVVNAKSCVISFIGGELKVEVGSGSGSNKRWKWSCGSAQLKGGSGSNEKK